MIHETNTFHSEILPAYVQDFLTKETLLFDIETTGLSPAGNQIYCIGCGYKLGDEICVELFLSEHPEEEADILNSFFSLAHSHHSLMTFNGTTFDIPFIRKRAALYANEPDSTNGADCSERTDDADSHKAWPDRDYSHLDLYQEVRKMRSLLGLSSCKQKSIEQFLGIDREDTYSGGELIEFYKEYLRRPDQSLLEPMLLHNREDVAGMFDLIWILAYRQFAEGRFRITDIVTEYEKAAISAEDGSGHESSVPISNGGPAGFMNIRLRPEYDLPQSIHQITEEQDAEGGCSYGISFVLGREAALIRIPVYRGELKHFFDDPENYYYLPDEDTAIYKSVGRFVDPSRRKRATKQTCFIKKVCDYLIIPVVSSHKSGSNEKKDASPRPGIDVPENEGLHFFKKDYGDKEIFLEIPADEEALKASLCAYFARFF